VSAPSPATGADAAAARKAERAAARRSAGESTFQVSLEHGRSRHLTWLVISAAIGILLLWKLGVVGKAIGVMLLLVSALHAYRVVRTLLRPPGRIEVRDDGVVLPAGLCREGSTAVPYSQVRHAFFLRRAVPWSRTGPILVIESEDQVFTYPRDWFSSDSDQRRVALALNRRLGRI
jgi:hypothetical protein